MSESSPVRAGVAVADITPPVGIELSGGAFGPSTAVLDPLRARALALAQGDTRMLLVSCDLLGFDGAYATAVRRAIAQAHDLPFDAILLAATHTHGAPATVSLRNWGEPDPRYLATLHTRLVEVAGQALAALRPARVAVGADECPGVTVNRCLGPEVGTHDRLTVARVESMDGAPLALLVNYACHPINLHSAGVLTADFPGRLEAALQAGLGAMVPVLFLQGAGGDLNPANFDAERTAARAEQTADRIAAATRTVLQRIQPADGIQLDYSIREVEVPLQPLPSRAELEQLIAERQAKLDAEPAPSRTNWTYCANRSAVEWAREALDTLARGEPKTSMLVTLQAFRIGPLGLVGFPGELFSQFGPAIAQSGSLPFTCAVTLANGCVGYFPSRRAYEKGTYEAVHCPRYLGLYAFQPGVGERLCEEALFQLRDLPLLARNRASRRLWGRACNVVVGGGQAHKRPTKYLYRGGPGIAVRGKGARFWDPDGHAYLDYLLSYGPIVLGHADPEVNAAVARQMDDGGLFNAEHPLSIEVAETLRQTIPCAEMTLYYIGGSSATQGAIRCARAHTGREKIIRCGYHGWYDWCFPRVKGVPRHERELILDVPYNNLAALGDLLARHAGEVAGVIIEAVQDDGPAPGYFAGVRRLCDEHGAVFILDEVKTGFRFDLGGAQKAFGIDPDLATFGKAMCNGWPASVVVGKRRVLQDRSDTYMGATFHADAYSLAAAPVVMRALRERDGIAHFQRLGRRLIDGLNGMFKDLHFPMHIGGFPPMPAPRETAADDPVCPMPAEFRGRAMGEFCAGMQRRGVYVTGHVWFLSVAHTMADIEHTIAVGADAAREALDTLKAIASQEPA